MVRALTNQIQKGDNMNYLLVVIEVSNAERKQCIRDYLNNQGITLQVAENTQLLQTEQSYESIVNKVNDIAENGDRVVILETYSKFICRNPIETSAKKRTLFDLNEIMGYDILEYGLAPNMSGIWYCRRL